MSTNHFVLLCIVLLSCVLVETKRLDTCKNDFYDIRCKCNTSRWAQDQMYCHPPVTIPVLVDLWFFPSRVDRISPFNSNITLVSESLAWESKAMSDYSIAGFVRNRFLFDFPAIGWSTVEDLHLQMKIVANWWQSLNYVFVLHIDCNGYTQTSTSNKCVLALRTSPTVPFDHSTGYHSGSSQLFPLYISDYHDNLLCELGVATYQQFPMDHQFCEAYTHFAFGIPPASLTQPTPNRLGSVFDESPTLCQICAQHCSPHLSPWPTCRPTCKVHIFRTMFLDGPFAFYIGKKINTAVYPTFEFVIDKIGRRQRLINFRSGARRFSVVSLDWSGYMSMYLQLPFQLETTSYLYMDEKDTSQDNLFSNVYGYHKYMVQCRVGTRDRFWSTSWSSMEELGRHEYIYTTYSFTLDGNPFNQTSDSLDGECNLPFGVCSTVWGSQFTCNSTYSTLSLHGDTCSCRVPGYTRIDVPHTECVNTYDPEVNERLVQRFFFFSAVPLGTINVKVEICYGNRSSGSAFVSLQPTSTPTAGELHDFKYSMALQDSTPGNFTSADTNSSTPKLLLSMKPRQIASGHFALGEHLACVGLVKNGKLWGTLDLVSEPVDYPFGGSAVHQSQYENTLTIPLFLMNRSTVQISDLIDTCVSRISVGPIPCAQLIGPYYKRMTTPCVCQEGLYLDLGGDGRLGCLMNYTIEYFIEGKIGNSGGGGWDFQLYDSSGQSSGVMRDVYHSGLFTQSRSYFGYPLFGDITHLMLIGSADDILGRNFSVRRDHDKVVYRSPPNAEYTTGDSLLVQFKIEIPLRNVVLYNELIDMRFTTTCSNSTLIGELSHKEETSNGDNIQLNAQNYWDETLQSCVLSEVSVAVTWLPSIPYIENTLWRRGPQHNVLTIGMSFTLSRCTGHPQSKTPNHVHLLSFKRYIIVATINEHWQASLWLGNSYRFPLKRATFLSPSPFDGNACGYHLLLRLIWTKSRVSVQILLLENMLLLLELETAVPERLVQLLTPEFSQWTMATTSKDSPQTTIQRFAVYLEYVAFDSPRWANWSAQAVVHLHTLRKARQAVLTRAPWISLWDYESQLELPLLWVRGKSKLYPRPFELPDQSCVTHAGVIGTQGYKAGLVCPPRELYPLHASSPHPLENDTPTTQLTFVTWLKIQHNEERPVVLVTMAFADTACSLRLEYKTSGSFGPMRALWTIWTTNGSLQPVQLEPLAVVNTARARQWEHVTILVGTHDILLMVDKTQATGRWPGVCSTRGQLKHVAVQSSVPSTTRVVFDDTILVPILLDLLTLYDMFRYGHDHEWTQPMQSYLDDYLALDSDQAGLADASCPTEQGYYWVPSNLTVEHSNELSSSRSTDNIHIFPRFSIPLPIAMACASPAKYYISKPTGVRSKEYTTKLHDLTQYNDFIVSNYTQRYIKSIVRAFSHQTFATGLMCSFLDNPDCYALQISACCPLVSTPLTQTPVCLRQATHTQRKNDVAYMEQPLVTGSKCISFGIDYPTTSKQSSFVVSLGIRSKTVQLQLVSAGSRVDLHTSEHGYQISWDWIVTADPRTLYLSTIENKPLIRATFVLFRKQCHGLQLTIEIFLDTVRISHRAIAGWDSSTNRTVIRPKSQVHAAVLSRSTVVTSAQLLNTNDQWFRALLTFNSTASRVSWHEGLLTSTEPEQWSMSDKYSTELYCPRNCLCNTDKLTGVVAFAYFEASALFSLVTRVRLVMGLVGGLGGSNPLLITGSTISDHFLAQFEKQGSYVFQWLSTQLSANLSRWIAAVVTVNGSVIFDDCSIEGMMWTNLRSIGGDLLLLNFKPLMSANGDFSIGQTGFGVTSQVRPMEWNFPVLEFVGGNLVVDNSAPRLGRSGPFDALEVVQGNLILASSFGILYSSWPRLRLVFGNLRVEYEKVQLLAFPVLRRVAKHLEIIGTQELKSLQIGNDNSSAEIGGCFHLKLLNLPAVLTGNVSSVGCLSISQTAFDRLQALDSLQHLNEGLMLVHNRKLSQHTMGVVSHLTTINGNIVIEGNPVLSSLSFLEQLEVVRGDIWIHNSYLTTLGTLTRLHTVVGDLRISQNSQLLDSGNWSSLVRVHGSIHITENHVLQAIDWSALGQVDYDLVVTYNSNLMFMDWQQLHTVYGDLNCSFNGMQSAKFPALQSVYGRVVVAHNTHLLELEFGNITTIQQELRIGNNVLLKSVSIRFQHEASVGTLAIRDCVSLSSLHLRHNNWRALRDVILKRTGLTHLDMRGLVYISGMFILKDNPAMLSCLLPVTETVMIHVYIQNNNRLRTITLPKWQPNSGPGTSFGLYSYIEAMALQELRLCKWASAVTSQFVRIVAPQVSCRLLDIVYGRRVVAGHCTASTTKSNTTIIPTAFSGARWGCGINTQLLALRILDIPTNIAVNETTHEEPQTLFISIGPRKQFLTMTLYLLDPLANIAVTNLYNNYTLSNIYDSANVLVDLNINKSTTTNLVVVVASADASQRRVYNLVFTVAVPRVTSIMGCSSPTQGLLAINCSTSGRQVITITGQQFSRQDLHVLVGGKVCNIVTWTTTQISCKLPVHIGAFLAIDLFQDDNTKATSRVQVSFARPEILSVRETNKRCQTNASHLFECQYGHNLQLEFYGRFLGETGALLFIGAYKCLNVTNNQTKLTCNLQAVHTQGEPTVIYLVQFQGLMNDPVEYDMGISFTQCPPGQILSRTSSSTALSCHLCTAGRFNVEAGATVCGLCDEQTYSGIGQQQCTLCAPDSVSMNTSSACGCRIGFYDSLRFVNVSQMECLPCSLGANCSRLGLTVNSIQPLQGYNHVIENRVNFLKCTHMACLGPACTRGHTGLLCMSCQEQYIRIVSDIPCARCTPIDWIQIIVVTTICLCTLVVTCLLVFFTLQTNNHKSIRSIAVRIVLNHLQISSLALTFKYDWPSVISSMFVYQKSSSPTTSSLTSISCFVGYQVGYRNTYWANTFFSAITPPIVCAISALASVLSRWPAHTHESNTVWKRKTLYVTERAIILLFFLLYSGLVGATLQMFNCQNVSMSGDVSVVYMDSTTFCYDTKHLAWIFFVGLPMLVLYVVGFIAIGMLLVYQNIQAYRKLRQQHGVEFIQSHPVYVQIRDKYTFLSGYQDKYWYFEFIGLIKKNCILLTAIFFNSEEHIQVRLVIFFSALFLNLHLYTLPHTSVLCNRLEGISLVVIFMTFFCGSFLVMPSLILTYVRFVSVTILLCNLVFAVACIHTFMYIYRENKTKKKLSMQCPRPVSGKSTIEVKRDNESKEPNNPVQETKTKKHCKLCVKTCKWLLLGIKKLL